MIGTIIEVAEIYKRYKKGDLHSDFDESGQNGFWDLSRVIDREVNDCYYCWGNTKGECKQEKIYNKLMEVFDIYKLERGIK
tara:strand:- start:83 stop:325 length:243 start_codon:yes stop_codon:yes gene_type:complete